MILQPINGDDNNICRLKLLRANIEKVLSKIDHILHSKKKSILVEDRNKARNMTFQELLQYISKDLSFHVTEELYIDAYRTKLKRAEVLYSRKVRNMRVNTFNEIAILANGGNMDLGYVLHPYGAANYMCSYMLKGEKGMSQLMEKIHKESKEKGETMKQQVCRMGIEFMNKQEICAQRAVFLVLGMPLRSSSRSTTYIPTKRSEERVLMIKNSADLEMLEDDSKDFAHYSVIDCFRMMFTQKCSIPGEPCLADFVAMYEYVYNRKSLNNNGEEEGEIPEDGLGYHDASHRNGVEKKERIVVRVPPLGVVPTDFVGEFLSLKKDTSFGEKMRKRVYRKRSFPKILRYRKFCKQTDPENYYRELLLLFLPGSKWASYEYGDIEEDALLARVAGFESFKSRVDHEGQILVENARKYDKNPNINYDNIVSDIMEERDDGDLPDLSHPNCENYEVELEDSTFQITKKTGHISCARKWDANALLEAIKRLNVEQRLLFDHVIRNIRNKDDPLLLFITGGDCVGKSVLLRAIVQGVTKELDSWAGARADNPKITIMAYTAKAARHVDGDTVHACMGLIPHREMSLDVQQLGSDRLNTIRTKYSQVEMVIIDEISLIGRGMFNMIDMRCREIFACQAPFGGKHVLVFGDLFQLKPVFDQWIFTPHRHGSCSNELWDLFLMYELQTIMRQDNAYQAERLNRMREGLHTLEDLEYLRNIGKKNAHASMSMLHLFQSNKKRQDHNTKVFNSLLTTPFTSIADDEVEVQGSMNNEERPSLMAYVASLRTKYTNGVAHTLQLKEGMLVEFCTNIDKSDGLYDGAQGIVRGWESNKGIIWVEFNDVSIGRNRREEHKYLYSSIQGIQPVWTPVFKETLSVAITMKQDTRLIRTQYPLNPCNAMTIHKSQGMTLENVCVDFRMKGIKNAYAFHYVGFSRVSNLNNVWEYEPGAFDLENIRADPDFVKEMKGSVNSNG